MNSQDAEVLERISKSLGIRPTGFEPVSGATHGVYRSLINEAPYILKLYRRAEAAGTELRVLRLLEEDDFPAPRVREADPDGVQAGLPFLLMEDLGRETVAQRMAQGADGVALAEQMGRLLASTHRIRLPSCGAILGDRIEKLEAAKVAERIHKSAVGLHAQKLISDQTINGVLAIDDLPIEGDSLCHMDFHPVQCVADGARVAGVVDWEGAWSANAFVDLAIAHAYLDFYGSQGATDAFLKGYGASQKTLSDPDYASARAMHLASLAGKWLAAGQRSAAERACGLLVESLSDS